LLAIVTGHPELAAILLPTLAASPSGTTLDDVLAGINLDGGTPLLAASLARVRAWLIAHPPLGNAQTSRFGEWATEVGRFSFTPALVTAPQNAGQPSRSG
jgi:hypothetical protein